MTAEHLSRKEALAKQLEEQIIELRGVQSRLEEVLQELRDAELGREEET